MGVNGVVKMAEELRRRGAVTDKTKLIATHFSHNGGLLHEELVEAFLPHNIAVAFDGMIVRA
jgi:phosphoribosyl 1,2-cyclic phosphate phosphodiesterase